MTTALDQQPIGEERLGRLRHRLTEVFGRWQRRCIAPDDDLAAVTSHAHDLVQLREALGVARSLEAGTFIADVRRRFFRLGTSADVRNSIADIIPELEIRDEDLPTIHLHEVMEAAHLPPYKMEGGKFLRSSCAGWQDTLRTTITPEVNQRLLRAQERVRSVFGDPYDSAVLLIFQCVEGDITLLEHTIEAQIAIHQRADPPQAPHFFEQALRFFGIYSDVSQHLIREMGAGHEIQRRSQHVLTQVFRDPRLQQILRGSETSRGNLFGILAEFFGDDAVTSSPWFCGDLKKTPFDASRVGTLITWDIPREVLARVLVELNEHSVQAGRRELRIFLNVLSQRQGSGVPEQTLRGQLISLVRNAGLEAYVTAKDPLESQVRSAKAILEKREDPLAPVPVSDGSTVRPEHVLVRLTHPKTVVKDLSVQQSFIDLCATLRRIQGAPLTTTERSKAAIMLARSLASVLDRDDPYLDVPLPEYKGRTIRGIVMDIVFLYFDDRAVMEGLGSDFPRPLLSLPETATLPRHWERNFNTAGIGIERTRLLHAARIMDELRPFGELMSFAQEEAAACFKAPMAHPVHVSDDDREDFHRTLLSLGPRLQGKTFAEAAPSISRAAERFFARNKRKHIHAGNVTGLGLDVAATLASLFSGSVSTEQVQALIVAKASPPQAAQEADYGHYGYFYYPTATTAFEALMHQCFPQWNAGDHVVITNQEYDSITRFFAHEKVTDADRDDFESLLEHVVSLSQGVPFGEDVQHALRLAAKKFFNSHPHVGRQNLNQLGNGMAAAIASCLCPVVSPDEIQRLIAAEASDVNASGVRVVYPHHRDPRGPKTADELFQDICAQVDPEKTRMILISSRTRFGDTPCPRETHRESHRQMAALLARLRERFPSIPLAIDGCQELGRAETPALTELKPDIYLTSGQKAVGAPAGLLALSDVFLQKHPFEDRQSTIPITHIVAMALALKSLRSSEDLFNAQGNRKDVRRFSLDRKIAHRMGELTAHAIRKTEEYGSVFVRDVLPVIDRPDDDPLAGRDSDNLASLFRCDVIYPVHRHKADYTGIVTLSFPNMGGKRLAEKLESQGYQVLSCLQGSRAIRISFHYCHTTQHIDALFDAIRQVHAELLEQKLKQGEVRYKPLEE